MLGPSARGIVADAGGEISDHFGLHPNEGGDDLSSRIANGQPGDFGRRTVEKTQLPEIGKDVAK
jgi:hypothetical protein